MVRCSVCPSALPAHVRWQTYPLPKVNLSARLVNLADLVLRQISHAVQLRHFANAPLVAARRDAHAAFGHDPQQQYARLVHAAANVGRDAREDRVERAARVPGGGHERRVRLRDDPVLLVQRQEGRDVRRDVGVVFDFCISLALGLDVRLTTGLILATFSTCSRSLGLKLDTPREHPLSVPSSTSPSSQPQNSPRWPCSGMSGLWTSNKLGMNVSLASEPATDALSSSRLCSLGSSGMLNTARQPGQLQKEGWKEAHAS